MGEKEFSFPGKTEETSILKWEVDCILFFFIFVHISLVLRFDDWEPENRSRFLSRVLEGLGDHLSPQRT